MGFNPTYLSAAVSEEKVVSGLVLCCVVLRLSFFLSKCLSIHIHCTCTLYMYMGTCTWVHVHVHTLTSSYTFVHNRVRTRFYMVKTPFDSLNISENCPELPAQDQVLINCLLLDTEVIVLAVQI